MRHDQRYKNYTMPKLILENYLRDRPLRLKELCEYSGHGYASLRVAKNKLRQEGRLDGDTVVSGHPLNLQLTLQPLGELTRMGKPHSNVNAKAMTKASAIVTEVYGKDAVKEIKLMNRDELRAILSEFIRQGGDGKNFIGAISALGSLGTDHHNGPPAPLSVAQRIAHLLLCMLSAEPSEVREAFAQWEVEHVNHTLYGEAPPIPSGHNDSAPSAPEELRPDELPSGDSSDNPKPDEPGDWRADFPGNPDGDPYS